MALPQPYVTTTYEDDYISQALELSAEAIKTHRGSKSVSKFLSKLGVKNLFLISDNQLYDSRVLVESCDVGTRWGKEDLMVNVCEMTDKHRKQWIKGAANAGGAGSGAVYILMDSSLFDWRELLSALASAGINAPTTLFFIYFCGYTISAQDVIDTLRHNPDIRNLAVYFSNLDFTGSVSFRDISLNNLHLEGCRMTESFVDSFVNLPSGTIKNNLTLVSSLCGSWLSRFSPLLRWQLRRLALSAGNAVEANDLVTFMQQRPHSSLCSLSLYSYNFKKTPTIIRALVDALDSSGLPFLDLEGLEQDAAIQAQLSRNQHSYILGQQQYEKVPALALRLFLCGDAYAGKTTLLSTLSSLCSPTRSRLDKAKAMLMRQGSPQRRTTGIEVHTIMRDAVRMSVWDMAGQTEFHAFHDHMFPNPSTTHGSPAMFMFVWSPVDTKDQRLGKIKEENEFEASFHYWLKFITSKTRQSNILRKLIVVLTHMDQTQLVQDALGASIARLTAAFSEIVQVVKVVEVDARNLSSVKPLASCIFQTAQAVLDGVEVYSICNEISKFLSAKHSTLVIKQPIISWDAFNSLCSKEFGVTDVEVLRAIAYSLNESGDIIYLSSLPFLVLDPNWFCHEVMGSLIHFPQQRTPKAIIPMRGYVNQAFLEKLLNESSHRCTTIEGSLLLALLEAMHLCCKVPGDVNGRVFIPATLNLEVSKQLKWRGLNRAIAGRSARGYAYVGRRLECDKKDFTFLTPGLFPKIQVIFNKAFCESRSDAKLGKADVQLGRNFISICVQEMEIIVEWCLAKGNHVIDVMVRAPNDEDVGHTLLYVEEEIIKTVISVCAQPIGNEGVLLVEGVIRPDCLELPASSRVREDQCVLILDLKQGLKEQLEGGQQPEKLLHLWEGNDHLQPITYHFIDLLGFEEYMRVLMLYKSSLEEASSMSFTATIGDPMQCINERASTFQVGKEGRSLMQEDVSLASTSSRIASTRVVELEGTSTASQGKNLSRDVLEIEASHDHSHKWMTEMSPRINTCEKDEQFVITKTKSMVRAIYREIHSMNNKLDGLRQSVDSMHEDIRNKLAGIHGSIIELRSHALPRIQQMVKQSLNFAIENEVGKIPRFVFLTTNDDVQIRQRMVTTLFKEVKHVRIELFCEHRKTPHRVDGQKGIIVTTMGDTTLLNKALPHANRILKVLTVVAKVGAHVVAGVGSMVPDLSKLIAVAMDTPGFLDNNGVLANVSTSLDEDLNGWQQWLVSVLEQNGGMTESNIANKFMLRRALYKDTSKVAWLCGEHYKGQCPLPLV